MYVCAPVNPLTAAAPRRNTRTAVALSHLTATVVALLAGPALAEEMTMHQAIEAVSLHEGPLDMVAYYVPAAEGVLEVTATFAAGENDTAPMRIVMALGDGDDVAFAMPGYPKALYRFVRAGAAISVSVHEVPRAGL
jgi:hypothetical protein